MKHQMAGILLRSACQRKLCANMGRRRAARLFGARCSTQLAFSSSRGCGRVRMTHQKAQPYHPVPVEMGTAVDPAMRAMARKTESSRLRRGRARARAKAEMTVR